MPIMELFGREYAIPYDPEGIANLMFRGIKVFPDDGADEKQLATEQKAINGPLYKLWGDKKLRTVPGGRQTDKPVNPSIEEGFETGERFEMPQFQGKKNFTGMNVLPTPKTQFNLRDIAPDTRKPLVTEM
jgi:hypothetical protein